MESTKSSSIGSEPSSRDAPQATRTAAPIILIDGCCVLCNRLAKFVILHDPEGRFRFATLDSMRAEEELSSRGLPPPPEGTFILVAGGRAYFRSEAALRLLAMLPFPWRLAGALRIIPVWLRDPVYSLVARWRYKVFGKVTPCSLLSADERRRFLTDSTNPGN